MAFWDMVAADSAKLVGAGGQVVETVAVIHDGLTAAINVPAAVARGQQGTGAINDRNRSLFDPEIHTLTSGAVITVAFNDAELIAAGVGTDLDLGWGLIPDLTKPEEEWDFARIESRSGGITTALFTYRDPKETGPRVGKRAHGF